MTGNESVSESQVSAKRGAGGTEKVPDLDDAQLRQLTEMVYQLIRDQVILEKERRGGNLVRDRR